MKEIERIIDDICKRIDLNYNGEIYICDRNHSPPNNWTRLSKEDIAKAIEQYIKDNYVPKESNLMVTDDDFCDDCRQYHKGECNNWAERTTK